MTESEAIKELQQNIDMPFRGSISIEASELAIQALEKQIPKKPVKSGVTDSKGIFHPLNGIDGVPYDLCPNCDSNLCTTGRIARRKMKYCQDCGQKLDWSEPSDVG